jgi:ubiquinone/menaquinone biosynthesis C-methylase UbiE
MAMPARVAPDPSLSPAVKRAADGYLAAARSLTDASYWSVKMFVATNLFLEHLDILDGEADPVPLFIDMFGRAERFLKAAGASGVSGARFSLKPGEGPKEDNFEDYVSGLFSDIWVGLTDQVYFDESYEFTKERFEKSGVDPVAFFKDKVVLDAGCGSGKFSAAIARFGAAQVIGMDIGEKGLEFARAQAKKVPYGNRLDYRYGSLLDIPLEAGSVDIVWSNGVIHHTLAYEKCVQEFARVLKPEGSLFLYVNGRFGLFELLQDTVREANEGIPRTLFLHYLHLLGINTGRVYFMMDCFYAPYEWKSGTDVRAMLSKHGFTDIKQLTRGVALDSIEQITTGAPYAAVKYGEGQLKYIARRA